MPRSSPRLLAACIAALGLTRAIDAHASAFEVFGFGPEGVAEVSARVARADDGTAAFYNPGGLAFGKGYRFRLSGLGALSGLKIQGETQELTNAVGGTVAADVDVPLEGPLAGRVRIGVGIYTLPDSMMHLRTNETSKPFYPYYDNRTQRFTVIPALSLLPWDRLGLGLGVNVLTGVGGPVDVREGQSRAIESRIQQEAETVAALVAGARVRVGNKLQLGATWRQSFGVPLDIRTSASIAGVPLLVNVSSAESLYDPMAVVAGASYDLTDDLTVEADGTWHRWSAWAGPLLDVSATVSALSLSTHAPRDLFQDTFGGRGAAVWRAMHTESRELKLHAGAGYETSMLSDKQQGRTNFVDGAKILFGLGGTASWFGKQGRALRLGAAFQGQLVGAYSQKKVACTEVPCPAGTVVGPDTNAPDQGITNPGYPKLDASGMVYVISLGVGVDL